MFRFSTFDILLAMTLIAAYVPAQQVHEWARDAVWESHGAFGQMAKVYAARPLEMTLEELRQYCEENGLEWEIYATTPTEQGDVQGVVIRSPKLANASDRAALPALLLRQVLETNWIANNKQANGM